MARGIRNNNPGNIEFGRFTRSHGAVGTDGRFARFNTPEEGIAAIVDLQRQYEDNYGLKTVFQRINRWAPSSDNNNPRSYAASVARAMGIDPNTPFSIRDPEMAQKFIAAMIQVENGRQPYTPQQIASGWSASRTAGGAPASPASSGPDQNTIRLAQEALRAQGIDVPLSGSLDSATQAGLQTFRASPGGMAFAQQYGLPVQPQRPEMAFQQPAAQQPAVQAVNAFAAGDQPPTANRQVAVTPDQRRQMTQPGSRRVQIARLDENGNPLQPPAPRPPVQMQIGPGQQATLPSLMPQPAAAAPMDTVRFDAGAPAPSRFDIAAPMARDLQFDPIAPRHLTDTWQNEPMISPGQGYIGPNGQVTAREYRWNGLANQATTPDNQGGPGRMNNLGVPTGPAPRPTTAPLPSLADYADPNGALMISAQVPPVNPIQQYMADQAEQYRQQDRAAGIPVMPPLSPADVPSVTVPEGQVPFPRPNPIPVAQRGRAGRTPNGYQWSHIPQRGGPTMLAVTAPPSKRFPSGRRWTEVLPMAPPTEFHSNFNPVRWG